MNKCACEFCNSKPIKGGRGYCRRHYYQVKQYGQVLDIRTKHDDNRIYLKDEYAEIVLTDGKDRERGITKISQQDIEKVKGHHWTNNGNGYVRTFINTKPLYLHRFLCNCPDDKEVDHINHDKMDNRQENLRIVSHSTNQCNNNGSCIRLITDRPLRKPYCVKIIKKGKLFYCKYFATEEEAIIARDKIRAEAAEVSPYCPRI